MGLNVMTNINLNTPVQDLIHSFVVSNFYLSFCHYYVVSLFVLNLEGIVCMVR